jgi:hypothetical protein
VKKALPRVWLVGEAALYPAIDLMEREMPTADMNHFT